MSEMLEAKWAKVKEALLRDDLPLRTGRATFVWHEENTRKAPMKATLYSKPNCPFCVRAKKLLQDKGIEINEVSAVENRDALIEAVTNATGAAPRTVPQIWLGETYIGGFTELDAHFKNA